MVTKNDFRALLSDSGPLSNVITGYQSRQPQQDMAQLVGESIQNNDNAIVEAGTGVGKTFAYLAPAIALGGRVIVSTGTRTLQDQLFLKDLPLVKKALKSSTQTALLKGRSNYLCVHRLRKSSSGGRFRDRKTISHLRRIDDWAMVTDAGDIAELSRVPHDSEVWPAVTSTVDNCIGADCDDYTHCHVVKARRRAQEADLVVVNHHLFFADLALKDEGFGELLPMANAIILDEAHQLPETASTFFSDVFSSRQVRDLSKDILVEASLTSDMPDLRDSARQLDTLIQELRLAMDKPGQREAWHKLRSRPGVLKEVDQLLDVFKDTEDQLKIFSERSKELHSCYERLAEMKQRLENMKSPQPNQIQWYEVFTRSFSFVSTPLNIAETFTRQIEQYQCSWIFTSATLAVDRAFEHFNKRMGLAQINELLLDSPFDYWNNSLLYAPANIPEPQHVDFVPAVVESAIPVIQASTGGVFMLFTSYRALNQAAEAIRDVIEDRPIMVQGEMSQQEMIDKFRKAGNAVLLGTGSFWEGVDVRGEALSCVIIDKLPFAAPNDPIVEARIQSLRDDGGNPFFDYQIPQAVIALKQGVGRLIRDTADRGVLVICDPRLRTKGYGRIFLDSLPRMPRTQKIEVVQRFFKIKQADTTHESE